MQANGSESNQHCPSVQLVAEVTKDLASADRPQLSYLAKKLSRLRASDAQPRAIQCWRQRPRRPGWVIKAVVQVLADQGEPMRTTQVHAAIEKMLGPSVSKDSVCCCLSIGACGDSPRFERVTYGCYRLAQA